jgi:hypothetical protein
MDPPGPPLSTVDQKPDSVRKSSCFASTSHTSGSASRTVNHRRPPPFPKTQLPAKPSVGEIWGASPLFTLSPQPSSSASSLKLLSQLSAVNSFNCRL